MDPLSALSIASAVAQFVGIGIKVANRLAEYTSASPADVPQSLQSINARLPLLLSALSRIENEAEINQLDLDSRCILRGVVAGCMRLIEDIEDVARLLVPQPGEKLRTKLKKVLSSLNSDDRISTIDRGLQTYIQVLILHHVLDKKELVPAVSQEAGFFEVKEKLATPFLRRKDLVSRLDKCFYRPIRRQADQPQIVVLAGEPGVGKTQLATGYCRESFDSRQFHLIFWIEASSAAAYQTSLQNNAIVVRQSKEGSPRDKFEFFSQFLANNWEPWLLVLDNYSRKELPENEMLSYLPSRGYGGIIVISESEEFKAISTLIKVPKYIDEEENEQHRERMSSAVENSRIDTIETLALAGFDMNQKAHIGWTFLERAALMGSEPIVRLLLASGANHLSEPKNSSALEWAAYEGHTGIVKILLDQEESTKRFLERYRYTNSVLRAVDRGSAEAAREIYSRRNVKLGRSNSEMDKIFCRCAEKGFLDTIKFLYSVSEAPTKDEEKANALRTAVYYEQLEVVQFFLLEKAFSIDLANSSGKSCLFTAASSTFPVGRATIRDEILAFLLATGANPNHTADDGETPLHAAARRSDFATVQKLLAAGANPFIKNNQGFTPLLLACEREGSKCFPLLADVDIADTTVREDYFSKPLFYCAQQGYREYIAGFIEKVDYNAVDELSGDTALLMSIKQQHTTLARYLIRRGAITSVADRSGDLPLSLAIKKGLSLVTRDLVKVKDSPGLNAKDAEGNTPLHVAAAAGRGEVAQELVNAGADVNVENKFGETAMDIAEEKRCGGVIRALQRAKKV